MIHTLMSTQEKVVTRRPEEGRPGNFLSVRIQLSIDGEMRSRSYYKTPKQQQYHDPEPKG